MELAELVKLTKPSITDIMLAISKLMESNNSNHMELKASNNHLITSLQSLDASVKEIKVEVNKLSARIDSLEDDVIENKTVLATLSTEINHMQQINLQRDVLIMGIPDTITNAEEFINKLNTIFKFCLNNIESFYMKSIAVKRSSRRGSGTFNMVTIKFQTITAKNILMNQVRKNGPLHVQQIYPEINKPDQNISIRDRLTQTNMKILKKLIELKKKNKIVNCWFRHNNVYGKIKEDDKPQIVWTLNDANNFK